MGAFIGGNRCACAGLGTGGRLVVGMESVRRLTQCLLVVDSALQSFTVASRWAVGRGDGAFMAGADASGTVGVGDSTQSPDRRVVAVQRWRRTSPAHPMERAVMAHGFRPGASWPNRCRRLGAHSRLKARGYSNLNRCHRRPWRCRPRRWPSQCPGSISYSDSDRRRA